MHCTFPHLASPTLPFPSPSALAASSPGTARLLPRTKAPRLFPQPSPNPNPTPSHQTRSPCPSPGKQDAAFACPLLALEGWMELGGRRQHPCVLKATRIRGVEGGHVSIKGLCFFFHCSHRSRSGVTPNNRAGLP